MHKEVYISKRMLTLIAIAIGVGVVVLFIVTARDAEILRLQEAERQVQTCVRSGVNLRSDLDRGYMRLERLDLRVGQVATNCRMAREKVALLPEREAATFRERERLARGEELLASLQARLRQHPAAGGFPSGFRLQTTVSGACRAGDLPVWSPTGQVVVCATPVYEDN